MVRAAQSSFNPLQDVAARTGVYTGLSLVALFTGLLVVSRMPMPKSLAASGNIVAAGLLAVAGSVPVVRFYRAPSEMLLSSLLGWAIFTLAYGGLYVKFEMLEQYYSTSEVFMMGVLMYLLLATLSWIGTIIWRVRAAHISHPRH